MKNSKVADLDTYIYVRIPKSIKTRIKEIAKKDGSNMTIWIRQKLIRHVQEDF